MKRHLSILLLCCIYSHIYAQTPYDSFSPATSRPILDVMQSMVANKDSLQQTQMDTTLVTPDNVSKWLSPDPLSDKYPEISPYAYCNWNPVKYIDPDGRYFDEVNEGTAQKIEAECQHKLSSQKINHNRRKELNKTLQDIADMRNDKNYEYRFESAPNNKPETVCTIEEGKNKVVTMYSNLGALDGTTAHEARHGGQIARGEMFYDEMGNPQNYGVRKEVDAYRAQWGWDGSLNVFSDIMGIPQNYHVKGYIDIDKVLVNSIIEGSTYLYPPRDKNGKLLIEEKIWKRF